MNKNQEPLVEVKDDIVEDKDDKKIHIISFTFGLLDKEIPENVEYISTIGDSDGYPVYDTAICPSCDREFEVECEEHYDYCPSCGQKLKWGGMNKK